MESDLFYYPAVLIYLIEARTNNTSLRLRLHKPDLFLRSSWFTQIVGIKPSNPYPTDLR